MLRIDDDRIPKQLLYEELEDVKRKVGGQKHRYKYVVKRHLKAAVMEFNNWEVSARDRV